MGGVNGSSGSSGSGPALGALLAEALAEEERRLAALEARLAALRARPGAAASDSTQAIWAALAEPAQSPRAAPTQSPFAEPAPATCADEPADLGDAPRDDDRAADDEDDDAEQRAADDADWAALSGDDEDAPPAPLTSSAAVERAAVDEAYEAAAAAVDDPRLEAARRLLAESGEGLQQLKACLSRAPVWEDPVEPTGEGDAFWGEGRGDDDEQVEVVEAPATDDDDLDGEASGPRGAGDESLPGRADVAARPASGARRTHPTDEREPYEHGRPDADDPDEDDAAPSPVPARERASGPRPRDVEATRYGLERAFRGDAPAGSDPDREPAWARALRDDHGRGLDALARVEELLVELGKTVAAVLERSTSRPRPDPDAGARERELEARAARAERDRDDLRRAVAERSQRIARLEALVEQVMTSPAPSVPPPPPPPPARPQQPVATPRGSRRLAAAAPSEALRRTLLASPEASNAASRRALEALRPLADDDRARLRAALVQIGARHQQLVEEHAALLERLVKLLER